MSNNEIGDKGMIELVKFCKNIEFLKQFESSKFINRKQPHQRSNVTKADNMETGNEG